MHKLSYNESLYNKSLYTKTSSQACLEQQSLDDIKRLFKDHRAVLNN